MTNNLPVTFHVHLQCISWIVLCVTFLWASLRHSVALHKTFFPTKKKSLQNAICEKLRAVTCVNFWRFENDDSQDMVYKMITGTHQNIDKFQF